MAGDGMISEIHHLHFSAGVHLVHLGVGHVVNQIHEHVELGAPPLPAGGGGRGGGSCGGCSGGGGGGGGCALAEGGAVAGGRHGLGDCGRHEVGGGGGEGERDEERPVPLVLGVSEAGLDDVHHLIDHHGLVLGQLGHVLGDGEAHKAHQQECSPHLSSCMCAWSCSPEQCRRTTEVWTRSPGHHRQW